MLFYALVLLKANTTVLLLLGVPFFSHSEEESLALGRQETECGGTERAGSICSGLLVCHLRSGIQQVEG